MDFYPWVVIAHVFFVIIAFGAHGTSVFAMFQARREADRARLTAVLDLPQASLGVAGANPMSDLRKAVLIPSA